MDAEQLHGTWDLVRWRQIAPDGRETHPFTDRARGRLLYDRSGRVAVFLMHPGWVDGSVDGPVDTGLRAYSGRFTVVDGAVHHLVDMASQRALINTTLVRRATLDHGVLRLDAPAADDQTARHVLEWRLVETDNGTRIDRSAT